MLEDIEAGKINTVVVKDLSRFGREYAQMGLYIEHYFEEKGIRFIAAAEGIDSQKGLDNLVFGRSKTKGFFDKRRVHTEESEWVVAENTHEPLITQEQWDTVHQMMKARRRENGTGTVQPFAGLVKCADCGSSLNLSYDKRKGRYTSFSCWVYNNIQQFIPLVWKYTDLQELTPYVLNELIEKIVVHEKVIGPDGVKTQQVDIYYKFIGLISQKAEGGCSGEVTRAARPREGRSA